MAKRERSKAYPSISLAEAISIAERVQRSLGRGPFERIDIAEAIGAATDTGPTGRKIAALVHYGLMERAGPEYQISELATRILVPRDDEERESAIREAFFDVTLFSEIISRYEEEGRVPEQVENRLVRDHGISNSAKGPAAAVFRASAEFAGVLLADGSLAIAGDNVEDSQSDGGAMAEKSTAGRPLTSNDRGLVDQQGNGGSEAPQQFRIALSQGRSMYMEVPSTLRLRDIEIIRKHIELLELQVEELPGEGSTGA